MTNCSGMARQRTHITFCNGFRTTLFSAAAGLGADGADGKSTYELAVERGFTGTLDEWLESLKAECEDCTGGEPEAPEPVRRLLVPTGATETANGEYQQFESDGTHELLNSFGVSGLTAELDPVDWMLPDSHEYRLVIQVPAGLDDLNPDVPAPPFVYMLVADAAIAELFLGDVQAITVVLSYVVSPEPALAIQLQGATADAVYLPYVIGQSITVLYQPLQQQLSVLADTTPVLEAANLPDTFAGQHLNIALMFSSFVPDATVQISAYAETLAVEPDRIGALESRIDDLEQAMAAVDELFDDANQRIDEIDGLIDTKISQALQSGGAINDAVDQAIEPILQESLINRRSVFAYVTNPSSPSDNGFWAGETLYWMNEVVSYSLGANNQTIGKNSFFLAKRNSENQFEVTVVDFSTDLEMLVAFPQMAAKYFFDPLTLEWLRSDTTVFLTNTDILSGSSGVVIAPSAYGDIRDYVHLTYTTPIQQLVLSRKQCQIVTIEATEAGTLAILAGQYNGIGFTSYGETEIFGDVDQVSLFTDSYGLQIASLSISAGDIWRVECQIIDADPASATGENVLKTLLRFEQIKPSSVPAPITQADIEGLPAALNELAVADVQQQAAIDLKLDTSAYNQYWQGRHNSVSELNAAKPPALGKAGDYAQVDWGIDLVQYILDTAALMWRPVQSSAATTTDEVAEGTINRYHTDQRVRDTPCTGLSTATATPVISTDLLIAAIGKLQAQISALGASSTPLLYRQGLEYTQDLYSSNVNSVNINTGIIALIPIRVEETVTIDRFGITTGTAFSGAQAKVALYEARLSGATYSLVQIVPQALLDVSGNTVLAAITASLTLHQNKLYFLAIKSSVTRGYQSVVPAAALALGSSGAAKITQLAITSPFADDLPTTLSTAGAGIISTQPAAFRFRVA